MMRLFCAWNLTFIGIIASVMVFCHSVAASGRDAFVDVSQIVSTHCQLWQRQLRHYPPAVSWDDYRNMLGRQLSSDDAEALYASTFGIADFTFLLGDWRAVATRMQRQEFNQYIFQMIEAYWQGVLPPEEASCLMEISLTEQALAEDAELPAPRLFLAKVETSLLGVPVAYQLKQDLRGWDITDISIGVISLEKKYSQPVGDILKNEGFSGLKIDLQTP